VDVDAEHSPPDPQLVPARQLVFRPRLRNGASAWSATDFQAIDVGPVETPQVAHTDCWRIDIQQTVVARHLPVRWIVRQPQPAVLGATDDAGGPLSECILLPEERAGDHGQGDPDRHAILTTPSPEPFEPRQRGLARLGEPHLPLQQYHNVAQLTPCALDLPHHREDSGAVDAHAGDLAEEGVLPLVADQVFAEEHRSVEHLEGAAALHLCQC
jgi:hypothetical protein